MSPSMFFIHPLFIYYDTVGPPRKVFLLRRSVLLILSISSVKCRKPYLSHLRFKIVFLDKRTFYCFCPPSEVCRVKNASNLYTT